MFLCWGDSDLGIAFSTHPGSQASSRGEAKDTALLSSRDGHLLEPTLWLLQPAPARARTLEAGTRWARLAQARAASRPGLCGILQARILEWVAVPFSRGFSQSTQSGLQEVPVATRKESRVLCFPSTRGLTPWVCETVPDSLPATTKSPPTRRGPSRGTPRGPSGLRWVWRNGRGSHLEGRQDGQNKTGV